MKINSTRVHAPIPARGGRFIRALCLKRLSVELRTWRAANIRKSPCSPTLNCYKSCATSSASAKTRQRPRVGRFLWPGGWRGQQLAPASVNGRFKGWMATSEPRKGNEEKERIGWSLTISTLGLFGELSSKCTKPRFCQQHMCLNQLRVNFPPGDLCLGQKLHDWHGRSLCFVQW